jgi:hypothetical protein
MNPLRTSLIFRIVTVKQGRYYFSIVWNPAGMEKEERRGGSAFLGLEYRN